MSSKYLIRMLVLAGSWSLAAPAQALNYYELSVYSYKTQAPGELAIENLTVYTDQGRKDVGGPESNQGLTRNSIELVFGVTNKTEIAGYLDYQRPRGGDWEHAATRLRTRTRFFEKGELPVNLGLYAELNRSALDDRELEFELRGIVDKEIGDWTLIANPILEKVVKGGEHAGSWELQYAASAVYRLDTHWRPRLDVFGDFGPLRDFDGRKEQKHLLSPAIGYKFGNGLSAALGVGLGLTRATEQRLARAKLEWEF
ncbi:MAG: transporter [Gammaproteobacteria bacterium]|nr:transporter [Gammaproteobacteria bacterium]